MSRIDEANSDQDNGDGERERVVIPRSELIELGEWRRREYSQRAREKRDLELAKMEEAKAIADSLEVQPRESRRPYCVPEGVALKVVWEPILDYICHLDDIIPARDTCKLFRSLLERKYVALRLNEVVTKFPNEVGDRNTLLNLRLVSRSSKAAVDELILSDTLDDRSSRIPNRKLHVDGDNWLERLRPIVTSMEQSLIGPNDSFLLTTISFCDYGNNNDPNNLGSMRAQFERLVGFVGSSIRRFEFDLFGDNLDIYNRFRSYVILMPNLVELAVRGNEDENEDEQPPLEVLPAFPTCPKLKRFRFRLTSRFGLPMARAMVAEILRANPTITEVIHDFQSFRQPWQEEEFDASIRSLETLQLTRYDLETPFAIPPLHFLDSRLTWPLKRLLMACRGTELPDNPVYSTRKLFGFVNSFRNTLEELNVDWKICDTGEYLDLPKLSKLKWKVRPEFKNLDFLLALESLKYLDVDLSACPQINGRIGTAKGFIDEKNLPALFPALKNIRVKRKRDDEWETVWKS